MRPPPGSLVFIDTNSIFEAHRAGCWNAVTARYRIETVQTCEGEACTRPRRRMFARDIVPAELRSKLRESHSVTDMQRLSTALLWRTLKIDPDPGERDLWAYVVSADLATEWFLCGPDKSSMRYGHAAGHADRLTCLESMVDGIGHTCRPPLREAHTARWLDQFRTEMTMGVRRR